MKELIFGSLTFGLIMSILTETVMFFIWSASRNEKRNLYLLYGPALLALFVLADWLVETNVEQVKRINSEIVQAVSDENAELIISHLSSSFNAKGGIDYAKASVVIRDRLNGDLVVKSKFIGSKIERKSDTEYEMRFTLYTEFASGVQIDSITSSWTFQYQKQGDVFKLNNVVNRDVFGYGPIDTFSVNPRSY
ncbi:MAG: hypothetical protein JEZ07_02630 [Phycisphaerae bacterium]|nr:hypothetical protein [Phycisphaerae bacterium]